MTDTVAACPECDAGGVTRHAGGGRNRRSEPPQGTYRCTDCGSHFEEFVERPRKSASVRRGLAGRLAAADPDEVSDD